MEMMGGGFVLLPFQTLRFIYHDVVSTYLTLSAFDAFLRRLMMLIPHVSIALTESS